MSEPTLNRYAVARENAHSSEEFLDLINTNFHTCGLRYPPAALAAWAAEYYADAARSRYTPDPAGSAELRAQISRYYGAHGLEVEPGRVVVTASASESYGHVFAALARAGQEVILPCPSYPLFEEVARRHGLEVAFYEMDIDNQWRIDPQEIDALAGPATAAIVLISPNNPTGLVVDEATILAVGETCVRTDSVLIVDEVFSEYLFDRPGALPGILPRPSVLCPGCRVCTINGVSKLFASPDLKVSWIVATGPDADRVAGLLEVQNDLYLSASSVSQHVASRMFDAGPESQRRIVREVATRRRAMLDALGGIPGVSFTPPAGGIHLPVRVGRELLPSGWDDQELAVALLERAGVAAHPGYLYGVEESDPTDPVVLVMSYLSPAEVIREGVDRIGSVLGRF